MSTVQGTVSAHVVYIGACVRTRWRACLEGVSGEGHGPGEKRRAENRRDIRDIKVIKSDVSSADSGCKNELCSGS